jgi:hypothetical protein
LERLMSPPSNIPAIADRTVNWRCDAACSMEGLAPHMIQDLNRSNLAVSRASGKKYFIRPPSVLFFGHPGFSTLENDYSPTAKILQTCHAAISYYGANILEEKAMFLRPRGWALLNALACSLLLSNCAIQNYPGQPGVRTNGFAKIDMETVDESGLWVYEVTYDNSPNGGGVEQIVTKLYPTAYTYTSNVRTNMDGTTYRHKFPYKGGKIEMISIPKEGTIILPPDNQIQLLVDYDISMDEIDDRNLSEEGLFGRPQAYVARIAEQTRMKWNLLKAGEFVAGKLNYAISKVRLNKEELDFSAEPVRLSTTISQTGVMLNITAQHKQKMRAFLNEKFPKGYQGEVELVLIDGTSFKVHLGLNTIETAKAAGKKVVIQSVN